MKKFEIEVKETLSRLITVTAKNLDQAIDQVQNMYDSEEIVLDSGDLCDSEIAPLD